MRPRIFDIIMLDGQFNAIVNQLNPDQLARAFKISNDKNEPDLHELLQLGQNESLPLLLEKLTQLDLLILLLTKNNDGLTFLEAALKDAYTAQTVRNYILSEAGLNQLFLFDVSNQAKIDDKSELLKVLSNALDAKSTPIKASLKQVLDIMIQYPHKQLAKNNVNNARLSAHTGTLFNANAGGGSGAIAGDDSNHANKGEAQTHAGGGASAGGVAVATGVGDAKVLHDDFNHYNNNILEAMNKAIESAKKSWGMNWTGPKKEDELSTYRDNYQHRKEQRREALKGFILAACKARRPLSIFGKAEDGYTASAVAFYQSLTDDAARKEVAGVFGADDLVQSNGKNQDDFVKMISVHDNFFTSPMHVMPHQIDNVHQTSHDWRFGQIARIIFQPPVHEYPAQGLAHACILEYSVTSKPQEIMVVDT